METVVVDRPVSADLNGSGPNSSVTIMSTDKPIVIGIGDSTSKRIKHISGVQMGNQVSMQMIRFLTISVVSMTFGCAAHPKQNQLPGRYEGYASNGKIEVFLHPDGSYDENIRLNDGATQHLAGSWEYSSQIGHVEFSKMVDVEQGKITGEVVRGSIPITKSLSSLQLEMDTNSDVVCRKVAN